jgi:hypothetical protein
LCARYALAPKDEAEAAMSPVTIYLARLIGLYCIVAALGMIAARRNVLPAVDAMLRSPPLLLFMGVVTIGVGLAMVVGHNFWSGGPATIVVTLIGWLSLAKGVALAFLPQDRRLGFYRAIDYERRFFLFMGATLLIGVYLTAAGFGVI